jgi:hypothetical protein
MAAIGVLRRNRSRALLAPGPGNGTNHAFIETEFDGRPLRLRCGVAVILDLQTTGGPDTETPAVHEPHVDVATFAGFDAVARPDRLAALNGTDDIIRTHQLRLPDEQGDLAHDLRASLGSHERRHEAQAQQNAGEAMGQKPPHVQGIHGDLSFRESGPDNGPNSNNLLHFLTSAAFRCAPDHMFCRSTGRRLWFLKPLPAEATDQANAKLEDACRLRFN